MRFGKVFFILSIIILSVFHMSISFAATFNVSTTAEFRKALFDASANGENDTIILESGTYKTSDDGLGTFVFSSSEANNLTIKAKDGLTSNDVIWDGNNVDQVIVLENSNTVNSTVTLERIAIMNGAGESICKSKDIILTDCDMPHLEMTAISNVTITSTKDIVFLSRITAKGLYISAMSSSNIRISETDVSSVSSTVVGQSGEVALSTNGVEVTYGKAIIILPSLTISGGTATSASAGTVNLGSLDLTNNGAATVIYENALLASGSVDIAATDSGTVNNVAIHSSKEINTSSGDMVTTGAVSTVSIISAPATTLSSSNMDANATLTIYPDSPALSFSTEDHTAGTFTGAIANRGYITLTDSTIIAGDSAISVSDSHMINLLAPKLETETGSGTCKYSVGPGRKTIKSTGVTGRVTVRSKGVCNWTAESNSDWITVTSGSSGSGNGSVIYTAYPHTGSESRTGTLTVGGKTLYITQQGITELSGSLSHVTMKQIGPKTRISGDLTLINSGDGYAVHTKLKVYLSDDNLLDDNDILLTPEAVSVGAIKGRSSKSRKLKYNVNSNPYGKYLIVVIDPDNNITEADKTNNTVVSSPIL